MGDHVPDDLLVTIKIHFGGQFVTTPCKEYVGGDHDYLDWVDVDKFSLTLLDAYVKKLGVSGYARYWYLIPATTMEDGLRVLDTESAVVDMLSYQKEGVNFFYVYIEEVSAAHFPISSELPSSSAQVKKGGVVLVEIETDESDNEYEFEELGSDLEDDRYYAENTTREDEWGGVDGVEPNDDPLGVGNLDNLNHLGNDHGGSINDDDSDFNYSSDDDGASKVKYTQFNPTVDMKCVKLKEGMIFSTANEFRGGLRDYAIKMGKEIRWIINDGTKLKACCEEGCFSFCVLLLLFLDSNFV